MVKAQAPNRTPVAHVQTERANVGRPLPFDQVFDEQVVRVRRQTDRFVAAQQRSGVRPNHCQERLLRMTTVPQTFADHMQLQMSSSALNAHEAGEVVHRIECQNGAPERAKREPPVARGDGVNRREQASEALHC